MALVFEVITHIESTAEVHATDHIGPCGKCHCCWCGRCAVCGTVCLACWVQALQNGLKNKE